jgi:hypothetical protein
VNAGRPRRPAAVGRFPDLVPAAPPDAAAAMIAALRRSALPDAPRSTATPLALGADVGAGSAAGDRTSAPTDLAEFQRTAVRRAEAILARHGCVVVADGVGLGKTHLGLALVQAALERAGSPLVIAPAALRRMWTARLPAAVPFLTHTALSRGDVPAALRPTRIVVDEAHGFRNPRSRRYRALARLCAGAELVLLTATPVHNSLMDLYFQLRLRLRDDAFADAGIPDLRAAFRTADAGEPGRRRLRRLLPQVIIRRSRQTVLAAYPGRTLPGGGPLRLPRRGSSEPLRYDLEAVYGGDLRRILRLVTEVRFAPLAPGRVPGRRNPPDPALLRALLLKRLESSVTAFAATVTRLVELHRGFLDALAAGRLLRPARRSGHGDADGQIVLWDLFADPVPPDLDVPALARSVRAELRALESIRDLVAAAGATGNPGSGAPHDPHDPHGPRDPRDPRDPKVGRLLELLQGALAGRSVLVFSEFADTARYLWRALLPLGGVGLVHGAGACLGAHAAPRREVLERFAPVGLGAPRPRPGERVRILITTDVLAEGLNLQDAAAVVSYDLPWNPIRLVQRIGRVDRLGSPHREVRCYHFMPDRGLDALLRLVRRLDGKLVAIRGTVGLDGPGPASAREADVAEERLWRLLLRHDRPELDAPRAGAAVPVACGAPAAGAPVLYAVLLDGRRATRVAVRPRGRVVPDPPGFAEAVLAALERGDAPLPRPEQLVAAERLLRRAVAALGRQPRGLPPRLSPRGPAARAARLLQRSLGAAGDALASHQLERAGRMLATLRAPPAGIDAPLLAVLAELGTPTPPPSRLLHALERVLDAAATRSADAAPDDRHERRNPRSDNTIRPVAALLAGAVPCG